MSARYARLKEWEHKLDTFVEPDGKYRARCNDTLTKRPGHFDEQMAAEPSWAERDALLDVMAATTKAHGIGFWLATMPHAVPPVAADDPDEDQRTLRDALNDATRRYCLRR